MNQGPRWAHIGLGADHTCATRANGTLWCWGLNGSGQLGIGNHTGQDRPRQVTTPAAGGWASVTAGDEHTCATRTGGTLWCWGFADYGQLGLTGGDGGDVVDLPQQVTFPAPGGWATVTADSGHTCAIRADGTLWCWGGGQGRPQQVTGCAHPPASTSATATRLPPGRTRPSPRRHHGTRPRARRPPALRRPSSRAEQSALPLVSVAGQETPPAARSSTPRSPS